MPLFVRLDLRAIKTGRLVVARGGAELDELLVFFQGQRFPRELRSSNALDRRAKGEQELKHGPVSLSKRIEGRHINAEGSQMLLDKPVMFRFVSGLSRQREFDVDLRSGCHPLRGQFAGFDLVLQGDLQTTNDFL